LREERFLVLAFAVMHDLGNNYYPWYAQHTLHNLLAPLKTIDYCFLEVARQWKLLTEDYVYVMSLKKFLLHLMIIARVMRNFVIDFCASF